MSKKTKLASRIITLITYGIFIWYFVANIDSFKTLLTISIWPLIGIAIFKLISIHNSGQFMKSILRVYSKNIPAREAFYIALLSSMGNFFGPYLGGPGVRAVYLKKKYKLSYTDFASTLSGYYIISFFVYSLIGILALVLINIQTKEYSWVMYLVMLGWLVGTIIIAEVHNIDRFLGVIEKRVPILHGLFTRLNLVLKGWGLVRENRPLFFKLNKLTIYGFLITLASTYFQFVVIRAHTSLLAMSLYVVLTNLSILVSITPGAIGIREAIFIFSSSLLGLNVDQIIQLGIIGRGITFVVMFVVYLGFKANGAHTVRKAATTSINNT